MKHVENSKLKVVHHLSLLSSFIGFYAVGFGAVLLLLSVFTGPSLLLGALLHITIGIFFLLSVKGLKTRPDTAEPFLFGLALTVGILCAGAIVFVFLTEENIIAIIYLGILLLFNLAIISQSKQCIKLKAEQNIK